MHEQTNTSFSQLVVQYERLVYTVCFQLVRDAAAAEEARLIIRMEGLGGPEAAK